MAGKHGRKKPTQKKSGNSTRARENVAPVVEEHVEEQSDGNNSDDLSPDLCEPSEEIKGRKRKNRSSISGGVSTRTRARKAVSDGNEPVGEDVVHEESTRVSEKTALSLSLDYESEDMSAVSSKSGFEVNMSCRLIFIFVEAFNLLVRSRHQCDGFRARPRFTLGFKVCAVTSRLSVFLLRFLPDS
ncbi:hypothetical protein F2Q70_00034811 [Brassica cretica]|uniref:Uncharacterized protein n=1 Tax=Brassica cretica TaxID=69181 RepID=A0A8S9JW83_BRACR|nr:hypothetical protein F2Q70_00034811 [Brassica cretica]